MDGITRMWHTHLRQLDTRLKQLINVVRDFKKISKEFEINRSSLENTTSSGLSKELLTCSGLAF